MRDSFSKQNLVLCSVGLLPVIWFALIIAPYLGSGLPEILKNLAAAISQPFYIVWCEDSVKAILIFILIYAMGIVIYLSTKKNYRHREEHGSAKWGNAATVCKKYKDRHEENNKLLTQNTAIGLDGRKHRRNLNVIIVGGSGSGKTRFYAKPNIMNANTSFVVLDPNGKIVLL